VSNATHRTLWCELAWLGGDAPEPGVVLDIAGERIVAVSAGVAVPPPDAERRAGLTLPGLVNAHSHAFHRALRGRTQAGRGSFWTWRDQMYAVAATLDPERYLALATAVYAEMALAGITTIGEFHYLHDGTNAMGEALIEAAGRAGVRITLLDTCYLHGGIGRERSGVQCRFGDSTVAAWMARNEDRAAPPAHARLGAAIHSVRAVDPDAAAQVAEWSAARTVPLHAHVSEQPAENEACLAAYGRTPTALLDDAGALSARFCAVHATHVTEDDIARLGRAGAAVALCPTTERDLADGIGPASALAGRGVRLCLGSDSHAVIDQFEEARAVELQERLASGERGHHRAAALLRAASLEGATALGWDAGIGPGALADFVTVRLDSVRLAGTRPADALAAAVFVATAADVDAVTVGGRDAVRAGRHQLVDDVPRALAGAIASVS
jgi:formiminoglutamate deiminase